MVPSGRTLCRALLLAAGLVVVVPARGDWPTYQANNQHSGAAPVAVNPAGLTPAWTSPANYTVPLIVGNSVYAMKSNQGSTSGSYTIQSFHLTTGASNWTYPSPAAIVYASQPTYAGGSLVFTSQPNGAGPPTLYTLDAATGALQYSLPLPNLSRVLSIPTVVTDPDTGARTAYLSGPASATGNQVVAVQLGATSASVAWQQNIPFLGTLGTPTVLGNSLLLASPGHYYALDRSTGAVNPFFTTAAITGGSTGTVTADPARNRFYVLDFYDTTTPTLTAYSYTNNSTIAQLWQKTGAGIRLNPGVAVGPDGKVYSVDNSTLVELDPDDGHVVRSITGRAFPNGAVPAVTNGKVWVDEMTPTFQPGVSAFDLATFTFDRSLSGGRGNANTVFGGPGAFADGVFIADSGGAAGGLTVYTAPVPEPAGGLGLAVLTVGVVVARRRGRR